MRSCVAFGCNSKRVMKNQDKVTFHSFPKVHMLRQQWIKAVYRDDRFLESHHVLCNLHFDESAIDRTGQIVRLREGAVPTIFHGFPSHLQKNTIVEVDVMVKQEPGLGVYDPLHPDSEASTAQTEVVPSRPPPDRVPSEDDGPLAAECFICAACLTNFPDKKSLARHVTRGCDVTSPNFVAKKRRCGVCPAELPTHDRSHAPAESHECADCGRKFARPQALKRHRTVHAGERDFACDACGRRFAFRSKRDEHARRHGAAWKYVCAACGKGFHAACDLRRHGAVHAEVKGHPCVECGKGFAQRSSLKRHGLSCNGGKKSTGEAASVGDTSSGDLFTKWLEQKA